MNSLSLPVLKLNGNWEALNTMSAQQAFSMMASDAATGLDIVPDQAITPVKWKDWLALPIRPGDDFVGTPRGAIRVPRVLVAVNFRSMLSKKPKLNMQNLRRHYQDRCAYTGKKLKPSEMSMEHVTPRSKGGATSWKNIVLADREVNSRRGNLTLDKAGLQLLVKPTEPGERLLCDLIENKNNYVEWEYFLKSKKRN